MQPTSDDGFLPANVTIIDAHHHFWLMRDTHCAEWLPFEPPQLQHDFLPADLERTIGPACVGGTVLVQAARAQDETEWLLQVARDAAAIRGVVGWVDPLDATAGPVLDRWREQGLVGVRLWNQADPDCTILDSCVGAPLLGYAARHDLPLDLLLRPQHLPGAIRLVRAHPHVRFIIDHAAKPDIAHWRAGDVHFEAWRAAMRAMAQTENVMCKLSGLITEAAATWTVADLRPYVEVLIDLFTPQRLVFGSDWPVMLKAGTYPGWLHTARDLTSGLSADERALIFSRNAENFYRL